MTGLPLGQQNIHVRGDSLQGYNTFLHFTLVTWQIEGPSWKYLAVSTGYDRVVTTKGIETRNFELENGIGAVIQQILDLPTVNSREPKEQVAVDPGTQGLKR
jgi:hypothetical protein